MKSIQQLQRFAEADKEAEHCANVLQSLGLFVNTARGKNLNPTQDMKQGDLFIEGNRKISFELKTTSGKSWRVEVKTVELCTAKGLIATREWNGKFITLLILFDDKFRKWVCNNGHLYQRDSDPCYFFDKPPDEFVLCESYPCESKQEALSQVMNSLVRTI